MERQLSRRQFVGSMMAIGGIPALKASMNPAAADARSLLARMSVDEKIGQLLCGRMNDPKIEEHLARGKAGFLIGLLAGTKSNATAAAEFLNHLQSVSRYPVLCVGEQEHGSARNFTGGTEFPAYMALGATRSKELAYLFGKVNTLEARAVGYLWVSCPTLDVNIEPSNPIINTRSLSDRPELVTELGVESCRGIVQNRGLTCICHFPGHGATSRDSHVELPVVNRTRAELEAVELAPYRAGIKAGYMNCIMTAHNSYPALEGAQGVPATISSKIMTDLLRRKMGYKGLIATDSLMMKAISDRYSPGEAAVVSIKAGCDILLSYDIDGASAGLRQAVDSGSLSTSRLDESVLRILEAKFWTGIFASPQVDVATVNQVVGCKEHSDTSLRLARRSITVLRNQGLPLPSSDRTLVISTASWNDLGPAHPEADQRVLDQIRKRIPDAAGVLLPPKELTEEACTRALDAARSSQSIVFAAASRIRGYDEESSRLNRRLFQLLEQVAGLGKPVALLVLGNPYVVAQLPATPVCLLAYSNSPMSVDAAVEVLFGEKKATGRLPISISKEYPFGHGL